LVSGISYTYKDILGSLKKIKNLSIRVESRKRTKEKVDHHYSNELIHNVLGDFSFTSLDNGMRKMHQTFIN
jgi:hypothetical protein